MDDMASLRLHRRPEEVQDDMDIAISKTLSWMLRHADLNQLQIQQDEAGYVLIKDLCQHLRQRRKFQDLTILRVVHAVEKSWHRRRGARFEIATNGREIRLAPNDRNSHRQRRHQQRGTDGHSLAAVSAAHSGREPVAEPEPARAIAEDRKVAGEHYRRWHDSDSDVASDDSLEWPVGSQWPDCPPVANAWRQSQHQNQNWDSTTGRGWWFGTFYRTSWSWKEWEEWQKGQWQEEERWNLSSPSLGNNLWSDEEWKVKNPTGDHYDSWLERCGQDFAQKVQWQEGEHWCCSLPSTGNNWCIDDEWEEKVPQDARYGSWPTR